VYLEKKYLAEASIEPAAWRDPVLVDESSSQHRLLSTCKVESANGDNITLIFRDCQIDDAATTFRENGRARELAGLNEVEDTRNPGFVYANRRDWCLALEVILFASGADHYDATRSSRNAERLLAQILSDLG
jgi:hypothetical protein